MNSKWSARVFVLLICLYTLLPCCPAHGAEDEQFSPGSRLAAFTFPEPDSTQTQTYLGLKTKDPFTLSKVGAKLICIEFLGVMCPQCHANAPLMNRLYKVIQEDPALAKDVKIIGIAVGNNRAQIEAYKKNFKVPFPIFPDEDFSISVAVGGVDTPTTILVTNGGKILSSHRGVIQDFDGYLKQLREFHKKL